MTWEDSWYLVLAGVVSATSVSFCPGVTPLTKGVIASPPRCSRVRRPYRAQAPWSSMPNCCVPALVIIDRKPCSTPSVTHSAHPRPVLADSSPESATGVTGPRKNRTWACWPRRYVDCWASWAKLRKPWLTVVVLSQDRFFLARSMPWMTPGRTDGKSSVKAKKSIGLKPIQPSRA